MPPTPNNRPSCRPAVPPPPVSGADVGKLGFTELDVCVDVGVDGSSVVTPGLAETEFVARAETDADVDAEAEAEAEADVEARAELDVDAPSRLAVADVEAPGDCEVEVEVEDAPDCELAEFVFGVGVKVGVAPPPEQAETATATRTAPAAERPAISHAPWVAPGLVRRIFTNLLLECVSDKFAFSASTPLNTWHTSQFRHNHLLIMLFPVVADQSSRLATKGQTNPSWHLSGGLTSDYPGTRRVASADIYRRSPGTAQPMAVFHRRAKMINNAGQRRYARRPAAEGTYLPGERPFASRGRPSYPRGGKAGRR